ncbi:hypothetical protein SAVIM40S_04330 [Streptomyces avidinii]
MPWVYRPGSADVKAGERQVLAMASICQSQLDRIQTRLLFAGGDARRP